MIANILFLSMAASVGWGQTAIITVKTPSGDYAAIYSDKEMTIPLANPIYAQGKVTIWTSPEVKISASPYDAKIKSLEDRVKVLEVYLPSLRREWSIQAPYCNPGLHPSHYEIKDDGRASWACTDDAYDKAHPEFTEPFYPTEEDIERWIQELPDESSTSGWYWVDTPVIGGHAFVPHRVMPAKSHAVTTHSKRQKKDDGYYHPPINKDGTIHAKWIFRDCNDQAPQNKQAMEYCADGRK